MISIDRPGSRPRIRAVLLTVGGGAAAALLAFALAPLGTVGLYAIVGVIVVGLVGFSLRADLVPPLMEAITRVRPQRFSAPSTGRRTRPWIVLSTAVVAVSAGGTAVVAGTLGARALAAVMGIMVAAVGIWLLWPLLHDLMTTPPADVPARGGTSIVEVAPRRRSQLSRAAGLSLIVVAAASAAWVAAQLGLQGLLAMIGGLAVVALLGLVKDRSVFFTFAAVGSLTFVLHKSLSATDLGQSGGAISIYVTTFDAVVIVLYGIWIFEGTFITDVRVAFRRPILWLPLAGAILLLPSLLSAPSVLHAASELFRMGWMYLLFVYVAVRVRTRRHVWAVLGGLAVFAVIELIVVALQATTGGVLGLSFLGVPTELGERTTDSTVIGRPFGTIIHPVFMGAVLGALALMALAMAIELQRSLARIAACALVPVCLLPLYVAQTRAALVSFAMVAVVLVGTGIARSRLTWTTVGRVAAGLAAVALLFLPQLMAKYAANFGTDHYAEEVDSRTQLNDIAGAMIADHWGLGVGLNNFELVLPLYERHYVIFFGNPVHNLYLLYLAETGILGFAGVVLVGVGLYNVAIRLARSTDRLLGGVGIGVTGAMAFLMIEELLGFSLRQDIPLAVYWLLAGLAVACSRLTGSTRRPRGGRHHRAPRATAVTSAAAAPAAAAMPDSPPRAYAPRSASRAVGRGLGPPRRLRLVGGALVLIVAGSILTSPLAGAESPEPVRIVLSAVERSTGNQGIFTLNGDGTSLTRITPADGRFYSWPRWAFGGSKIVYTVRSGPEGSPEDIALMNPDGTDAQLIEHFEYRVAQPSIDESGSWLYYTSRIPWFPLVSVLRMDLRTLESVNLTAITVPVAGFDSDPTLASGQQRVVLATSDGAKTAINLLDVDGAQREVVTHDAYFNTDPDISRDERLVAMASYRGPGTPSSDSDGGLLGVKVKDWHLVATQIGSGAERVLTQGLECATRPVESACTIPEMSAFVPRFTADGSEIGFVGALDNTRTCICVMATDGTSSRIVLESAELAIDWFDWSGPGGHDPGTAHIGTAHIGTQRRDSSLLLTMSRADEPNQLVAASPDLMHRSAIPLPDGLVPQQARWSPDRARIVFTARVPVPSNPADPHPGAPAGSARREHITVGDLEPLGLVALAEQIDSLAPEVAEQQVFLRHPDGHVEQLTDPWIEDWQDGLRAGDVRSNTNPIFAPDGGSVVVTNTSAATGESFLLRIDLATGAVVNLTNGTAGALAVADTDAAFSPDGSLIAFSWSHHGFRDIYLMDAADGANVRAVTADDAAASSPLWLPDGSGLVYTSERNGTFTLERVPTDRSAPAQPLTAAADSPALAPVVAPEGDRVLFISPSVNSLGARVVPVDRSSAPALLQPDSLNNIHFADWR